MTSLQSRLVNIFLQDQQLTRSLCKSSTKFTDIHGRINSRMLVQGSARCLSESIGIFDWGLVFLLNNYLSSWIKLLALSNLYELELYRWSVLCIYSAAPESEVIFNEIILWNKAGCTWHHHKYSDVHHGCGSGTLMVFDPLTNHDRLSSVATDRVVVLLYA